MEFPRPGVESELLAYTTVTATPDPSCTCDLHHNSEQCWILNPLSKARDWTCVLMGIRFVSTEPRWELPWLPLKAEQVCDWSSLIRARKFSFLPSNMQHSFYSVDRPKHQVLGSSPYSVLGVQGPAVCCELQYVPGGGKPGTFPGVCQCPLGLVPGLSVILLSPWRTCEPCHSP